MSTKARRRSSARNGAPVLTPGDVLGDNGNPASREIRTHAPGPTGALPFTAEFLTDSPSGDHFGMTQNAGMGWNPAELTRPQYIILSTAGGIREPDGSPVALGLHTGHFELSTMVAAASEEFRNLKALPFATFCSDPCDGRTQGTTGMMDSLPYRNDAAVVLRRQARSLPTARGVMGVASCDKGLPAMMMALAGLHDKPVVTVPGGVTLAPESGEDAGMIQSIGARFAQGRGDAGVRPRRRLQSMRLTRRRMPVPRHSRHLAGSRRSPRSCNHARRAVAIRHSRLDGCRCQVCTRARHVRSQWTDKPRHTHRCRFRERHGSARGLRWPPQTCCCTLPP